MSKQSVPLIRRCSVPGCIRKIGLAWLFAVVMEQALLPQALRDLEKLEGLRGVFASGGGNHLRRFAASFWNLPVGRYR